MGMLVPVVTDVMQFCFHIVHCWVSVFYDKKVKFQDVGLFPARPATNRPTRGPVDSHILQKAGKHVYGLGPASIGQDSHWYPQHNEVLNFSRQVDLNF
jgi:hypothetical protein